MNNATKNNRPNPDTLTETGSTHNKRPEPEHSRSGTSDLAPANAGRRSERGAR
jgi:hypothetical protein